MVVTTTSDTICEGQTATLTANGGVGSTYQWSNGGNTDTINPVPGATTTYTVTATNGNCSNTATAIVTVNQNPVPVITGPSSICVGNTATLDAGAGYSSYLWSNNATTETIPVTTPGTYSVTVSNASGCTGTTSTVVTVNPNLTPAITGPSSICSGNTATLDAGAGSTSYLWSNNATTETIPVTTAGTYTVTVSNSLGCSGTASTVVTVNQNPTPIITGTTAICAGNTATLDAGVGYASYLWSNSATNETVSISTAGTYTVTVSNSSGCIGTSSFSVNIIPIPVSQFTLIVNTNTVNFATTYNASNIYFWNFGDGTISNQSNPVHTFTNTGYFNACLNVTDTVTGCQSNYCSDILIGSSSTACLAKFGYSLSGNTVTFTDSSLGNPNNWYWQFGDATTSTLQNPVHTYTNNGLYNISLTISNSATDCSNIISKQLNVNNINDCVSGFSFYSDVASNTVTFTDQSLGDITSYLWSFGDDSSSILQNPVHTYQQAGYYNVCHTVFNTSTACYNILCNDVTVGNSSSLCKANFIFTLDTVTRTVQFSDCSFGSPDEWTWNFGDNTYAYVQNPSHTYGTNGIYSIQLNILNDITNCSDFIVQLVNVNSTQSLDCEFGYNNNLISTLHKGSKPEYPVAFVAAVFGTPEKYVWSFGDKGKDSSTTTPTHYYDSLGTYNVCLFVENNTINESKTYCKQVEVNNIITNANDYLQLNSLNIFPNPANDNITIINSNFINDQKLSIYNIQGQLLIQQPMLQARTNINISALPVGMYYIEINTNNGVAVKVFVKD